MTNWMTAAGLAFIAGGLATLISFRAVIFGGGARRATRAGAPARRRRSRSAAPEPAGPAAPERPGRRRRLAAAFSGRHADTDAGQGALASIGLADDGYTGPADEEHIGSADDGYTGPADDEHIGSADDGYTGSADIEHIGPARDEHIGAAEDEYEAEPVDDPEPATAYGYGQPEPRPVIDRSDRAYGDRIDDWVRPRYRDLDDRPPAGDYWTPVPDDLYTDPEPSARGYGWPVPVERLPPVPDYEPATGFDLTPVEASEPTTLVPSWPPEAQDRRIRLPRSWGRRDEKARPRPRPRPAVQEEPYVSRHSAGPHG